MSFSSATVGSVSPFVRKKVHALRSELNSSVKKNGTGVSVGLAVGAGVNVIVAVAGMSGVGGAMVRVANSTCLDGILQAVRIINPIKIIVGMFFLFMDEL